jgi:hypothetical protein
MSAPAHIPSTVGTLVAALAAGALAVAGCGVGPGEEQSGSAELVVTRDHGAERLLEATVTDPPESETVVRFLDREAEIETEYAGNFVSSIDGVRNEIIDGRSHDWFFYVNGYWSPIGAGEATVHPGDRVWWDNRDWTAAYRVPAVVGSWPEPFLHGYGGEAFEVEIACLGGGAACERVRERLAGEGVEATVVDGPIESGPETLRILVGPWEQVRTDRTARAIERGPAESGVYASPSLCRGSWRLIVLGADGQPAEVLEQAGFVAAVQRGDDQPAWLVTATAPDSLDEAVALLDTESLTDRYAIAAADSGEMPMPAPEGTGPVEGDC